MLMILQIEAFHEWEWQAQLVSALTLLRQTQEDLRQQPEVYSKLIDYLSITVDKHRIMSLV